MPAYCTNDELNAVTAAHILSRSPVRLLFVFLLFLWGTRSWHVHILSTVDIFWSMSEPHLHPLWRPLILEKTITSPTSPIQGPPTWSTGAFEEKLRCSPQL
ncbi:unnamed protein product [Arctogadus glacialis]